MASSITTLTGRGARAQFINCETKYIAINRSDAIESPVVRELGDELVIRFGLGLRAFE